MHTCNHPKDKLHPGAGVAGFLAIIDPELSDPVKVSPAGDLRSTLTGPAALGNRHLPAL